MKKYLGFLIVFTIVLLSVGCSQAEISDNSSFNPQKDVLSDSIWVFDGNEKLGLSFAQDGTYALWEVVEIADGRGGILEQYYKYEVKNNIIKLFDYNLYISGETIKDVEFKFTINKDSLSLYNEYTDQTGELTRLNISLKEYAGTIGLPIYMGA